MHTFDAILKKHNNISNLLYRENRFVNQSFHNGAAVIFWPIGKWTTKYAANILDCVTKCSMTYDVKYRDINCFSLVSEF